MKQIIETIRSLLKSPGALAIFAGLYALLLAALYGFIATKEAKVWQILLTLVFVACAPVIFFLLQAVVIRNVRETHIDWPAALRDSCKLALLTLPLVLIGWGIAYLLNRWQMHYPTPHLALAPPLVSAAAAGAKPVATLPIPPTHWPTVLFATARTLIFVIGLPLAMIHLWVDLGRQDLLAFVRTGPKAVLKSLGQTLARAFALESILIYSLGLIVFGLIPYVLLFTRVTMGGTWREVAVFSARLALVFVFTLFGWVLMLSTFAKVDSNPPPPSPAPVESSPTEGEAKPLGSATITA